MRRMIPLILLALLAPFPVYAASPQTLMLDVQNMTCPLCPITVRKSLEKVPGVSAAKIDFEHKTATVTYDPDQANAAALTRATSDAGYPSSVHRQ